MPSAADLVTLLTLLACAAVVHGLVDADTDGKIWEQVVAPSGNVVWRKVDPSIATSPGPSITVLQPYDMVTWFKGTPSVIAWNTAGFTTSQYVSISLYEQRVHPNRFVLTITHSTPAIDPSNISAGSFKWNCSIPTVYNTDAFYKVAVTSLEDSHVVGTSGGLFRILAP